MKTLMCLHFLGGHWDPCDLGITLELTAILLAYRLTEVYARKVTEEERTAPTHLQLAMQA